MSNDSKNKVEQKHTRLAIENRCEIILKRKWPLHEIDSWLALLPPNDRAYAEKILKPNGHSTNQGSNHGDDGIIWPRNAQEWIQDAELTRRIWNQVDENKWW